MGSRTKAGSRSVVWEYAAYVEDVVLERAAWAAAEEADDDDEPGLAIDLAGEVEAEQRWWERATAEAAGGKTIH